MRRVLFLSLTFLCFAAISRSSLNASNEVIASIIVPKKACEIEQLAAAELADYLLGMYSTRDLDIRIGTPESAPELVEYVGDKKLQGPESYIVTTAEINNKETGIILGQDSVGVMYGVYALLEKLGCGFYLSYETVPTKKKSFSFDGWDMQNKPLVKDRIVFNWHNFLSGCSAWDLEDWQKWINQSQKMGYNTIMVHAYGNNPMFDFSFNGVLKPTGVLTDTSQGHQWGTATVSDVRRMIGGDIYDGPVFGAKVAGVQKEKMPESVQALMKHVFEHADRRGMKICFAMDVATKSANPAEIISTMNPETLLDGKLVNPETEEGFAYYKAQMSSLMKKYPQINIFGFWMRVNSVSENSMRIPEDQWPDAWRKEYQIILKEKPSVGSMELAKKVFVYSRIAGAYRKALDELGHSDVRLFAGSWRFNWWPAANECFSKDIALLGLDTHVLDGHSQFEDAARRQIIKDVADDREAIPIAWAHHDDGAYIGGMLTPHENFYSKLSGSSGFGIIHWMMHPFDLYFKNLGEQVWSDTKNRPLDETIRQMAIRVVGEKAADPMSSYLGDWARNAPVFGRETTRCLVTEPIKNIQPIIDGCRKRMLMLSSVLEVPLTSSAKKRVLYFKELERFIIAFYQDQGKLQEMAELLNERKLEEVHEILKETKAEQTVRQYVKAITSIDTDKGEKGYLFQLTTDWYPFFSSIRQVLGQEPAAINFASENFDPLAQAASDVSWFVSDGGEYWVVHGAKKTKAKLFSIPKEKSLSLKNGMPAVYKEVCRTGVLSDRPISFSPRPITFPRGFPGTRPRKNKLKIHGFAEGSYELKLLFVEPFAQKPGERMFDVEIVGSAKDRNIKDTIDVFAQTGGRFKVLEKIYPVQLEDDGYVQVNLKPRKGKALICGAILEPRRYSSRQDSSANRQQSHIGDNILPASQ